MNKLYVIALVGILFAACGSKETVESAPNDFCGCIEYMTPTMESMTELKGDALDTMRQELKTDSAIVTCQQIVDAKLTKVQEGELSKQLDEISAEEMPKKSAELLGCPALEKFMKLTMKITEQMFEEMQAQELKEKQAKLDSMKMWQLNEFVDDFGDPTGQGYAYCAIMDGTFSNSATTNATLYAVIFVEGEAISIKLKEYGSNDVKNYGSTADPYKIKMKIGADVSEYRGYLGESRITVRGDDAAAIKEALLGSEEIKFHLEEDDSYSNGDYNFVYHNPGNLQAILDSLVVE